MLLDCKECLQERSMILTDLPPEMLDIIFAKVLANFGEDMPRQAIYGIKGSCRTLRRAMRLHQASVSLAGEWTQSQIAGLLGSLPRIVRLGYAEEDDCAGYIAYNRKINPQTFPVGFHLKGFNCCSNLRHLDLRFRESQYSQQWRGLKRGFKLPQHLTYLRLPSHAALPRQLCQMVETLQHLRCLVCKGTEYYPTKLTNLQSLSVGSSCPEGLPNFCEKSLAGLCQLTSLQLHMNDNDSYDSLFLDPLIIRGFRPATEDGPPLLLDLRVVGCMDPADLTCLLNPFHNLQALKLHIEFVGASKLNAACLLRPCRSSLRRLSVKRLSVDLGVLLELLRHPDLLDLEYLPPRPSHWTGNQASLGLSHLSIPKPLLLGRQDIGSISSLSSLTRLHLLGWREWSDLSALHHLSLVDLTCSNIVMLYELLTPPHPPLALQNLRRVSLGNMTGDFRIDWLMGIGLVPGTLFMEVGKALLSLPNLEILAGATAYSSSKVGMVGEMHAAARTVNYIVRGDAEHWVALSKIAYRRRA